MNQDEIDEIERRLNETTDNPEDKVLIDELKQAVELVSKITQTLEERGFVVHLQAQSSAQRGTTEIRVRVSREQ